MNAEHHHHPLPVDSATHGLDLKLSLSAMVDSELDARGCDALLGSLESDALSNWHAYQVIGDVLRGHPDPTGNRSATDFLAAVRLGLEDNDVRVTAQPRPVVNVAVATSGAGRRDAANDAVFRWKVVAGFASLAAVMAVSWSVVSGSNGAAAGAQLASNAPAAVTTTAATAAPAVNVPVAVSTGQGVVIRDAQLEALLAEHRQHGGMSALQMPSGFIRNATYEAAGR